jgi:hypothetical protein
MAALLVAGSSRVGAADLLANGGFEQGVDGWSLNAGVLDAVPSPVHAGALAGRFSGTGQPSTQFAYQVAAVQPDDEYEASGWMAGTAAGGPRAFLRISWFDASDQLVSHSDSAWLPQFDGAFYPLTTGVLLSPSAARKARLSAVVQADSTFAVHLDDLQLAGPAAIPSTPIPPTTPTPPGPPSPTPPLSPTPSPARPTPTPRPGKTPSPSSSPAPPATPALESEPLVWPELVNTSFEQLRDDGSPLGWRKQGGNIGASAVVTDGVRSLALSSQTGSTKWAYQTVGVTGGAYYRAAVDVDAGQGAEAAFLRLAWYASDDGSGPALSSVDSTDSVATSDGEFRRLTTDVVYAPLEAATVKFRLMLRPLSNEPAVAFFDFASFSMAQPSAEEAVLALARATRAEDPISPASLLSPDSEDSPDTSSGAQRRLANVKPETDAGRLNEPPAGGKGEGWAIALALAIALSAIAIAGGYELWQRRTASGKDASSPED